MAHIGNILSRDSRLQHTITSSCLKAVATKASEKKSEREREVFLSITQGVIEITQGKEKVIETARNSSWNKAGVEPVHYYRPRLTHNWFSGTHPKGPVLFRLMVQIKQKRSTGVENTSRLQEASGAEGEKE